jgi:hypothetical protein
VSSPDGCSDATPARGGSGASAFCGRGLSARGSARGLTPDALADLVIPAVFAEGDHVVVEPNGETFTFRKEAPATVAS